MMPALQEGGDRRRRLHHLGQPAVEREGGGLEGSGENEKPYRDPCCGAPAFSRCAPRL